MPMFKHLIWDFDGTLYDTCGLMTDSLLRALDDFHCKAARAEACALIKRTLYEAVCVYAARFYLPADGLMAAYRKYHAQQRNFPAMPGMMDCIRETSREGCQHYLFTHRDRAAVEQLLADGLSPYFTDAVTREDGFADKPAPDAILYLMAKHGFRSRDACMIGDREIDMESAKAAGIGQVLFDPDGYCAALDVPIRVKTMSEIRRLLT